MRIYRINLSNIKSYRKATIHFEPGTTAIRGQNGAGKSTLLEAIGFALFDHSPYKQQAQLVREGERVGQITVAFQSAFDDRAYEVVRRIGASADWYIYDPQLGERVVEQHADVEAFLRRHLRIEGEITLDSLFSDALGVPQGTFTADFLMTPANRRKKFDTLLQVEDYAKAFEKLGATGRYLKEQMVAQDHRIDLLERETGQLDAWREQLTAKRARERELIAEISELQREMTQSEGRREELRQYEALVAQRAAAAQLAQAAFQAAEARANDAQARYAEARYAVTTLAATRADYLAYQEAETHLAASRTRAHARDELRNRRHACQRQRDLAERDSAHASELLAQAQAAATRIAELHPLVLQQSDLERARDHAHEQAQQLVNAQAALKRAQKEIDATQGEIASVGRDITRLEALRPVANRLEERSTRLEAAQQAAGAQAQRARRLQAIAQEITMATKAQKSAQANVMKAQEAIEKIRRYAALAAEAPELEQQQSELDRRVRALETTRAHHEQSRALSGGGNCPFLREPCKNIRERNADSLTVYFDRLIAECDEKLAPLREELAALVKRLDGARTAREYYGRLDTYQQNLDAAQEAEASATERLDTLNAERDALEGEAAAVSGAGVLAEAKRLYDESAEADKQLSALATQRDRLARATERLDTLTTDAAGYERQIETLAQAPQQEREASQSLKTLGDPRAEALALAQVAGKHAEALEALASAQKALAACAEELARLDEALNPLATLDDEIATLEARREKTHKGHVTYVQHEQAAAQEPTMRKALAAAQQALALAAKERDIAQQAHEAALEQYDATEAQQLDQLLSELREKSGRSAQELTYTQQECVRIEGEIERVGALLLEVQAARAERQQLDETEKMLQQFRDIIKEAGPYVMRTLLRQISQTANRIFGELMGDNTAQLSWEEDYEIVLRRDGNRRVFAQLSGGEQMSAALAVRLALLRRLSRLDIAFFDEPTQNMDGERRGALAEQVRRVRGFDQLIVISHDDTFEQGLDNVIYLVKRNGETVVTTSAEEQAEEPVALFAGV